MDLKKARISPITMLNKMQQKKNENYGSRQQKNLKIKLMLKINK